MFLSRKTVLLSAGKDLQNGFQEEQQEKDAGTMALTASDGSDLTVCLHVAFSALGRRLLARGHLLLVAVDTGSALSGRIMERGLQLRLHRRRCRVGVAVGARLVGRFVGLFRLRRVVALLALEA